MASGSIYSDSYRHLTEILKTAREQSGLTQTQLAEALGEDQSFISKVERRERRLDLEELRRYCAALGCSVAEIVSQWEAACETGGLGSSRLQEAPDEDNRWGELDWKAMLDWLVQSKLLSYKEIAALTLGHLNPSQVGTSIASKKSFQKHFPPRKCWQAVREWHFAQSGKCINCGTRLELQADHVETRQDHGDIADRLDNMTLRCRRCNVIRRPSHKQGGLTFLTAEAALMWILLTKRPRTYQDFERLCRSYGMTMANIRFQESWAMARWLEREGLYDIDADSIL